MKFLNIIVAIAITAAVVYYGLNHFFPHHGDAEVLAAKAPTTDTAVASAASTPSVASATSSMPAPASSAAGTAAATPAAPASSGEQALADKVGDQATDQVVKSMGGEAALAKQGMTKEQVHDIAQQEAQKAVDEKLGSGGDTAAAASTGSAAPATAASTASAPAGSNASTMTNASSTPAGATTASMAPPASTAAAPAAETPSAPPPVAKAAPKKKIAKAKPAAHAAHVEPVPEPTGTPPPGADALTAWWAPSAGGNGGLSLDYAGSAAFEHAIVLLFSSPMGDAATAGQSIQVLDADGKPVDGSWTASDKNPRMLIFKARIGRYTVLVKDSIKDADGRTLGRAVSGPVYVR